MPERRFNGFFSGSQPWLSAAALATLLALSACDNSTDQSDGANDSQAAESNTESTAEPSTDDTPTADSSSSSTAPSPKAKLETRHETFRRTADHCSGDDCPIVTVDMELYEGHPELNQAVRRRLTQQLAVSGEDNPPPSASLEDAAKRFLATAGEIPGEGARGWKLNGETSQLGRWKDLLTVAIDSYEFTGGAHGMPVTRWLNWDLTNNRPVSLGQVIRPGQEDTFEQAARQAHDQWLDKEVDSDQDFREAWPFHETSDFRFTRKGLVLHYDVYTIAPYVMGQPTLTVPWEALKDVVRDDYRPKDG